jgi:uncharacterized protein YbaP (TraB family)
MYPFLKRTFFSILLAFFVLTGGLRAQTPKYPSLLWEITGKGLKKPSYLFGTMHVSNKKVFHLSDSFFIALRNADVVALELNPDIWQEEMVRLDRSKAIYNNFYSDRDIRTGYVTENTFRQEKDYLPAIKRALQESPMVINSLLYRTMEYQQDYEEDTFLDMYIYQTGKKLGKRASGVENYVEMDRLTMEAVIDRSKEKNKKKARSSYDYDDDLGMKSDEAYRKGDLDLLDSLQKITETSPAFTEKFLYRRNEIQGNSMDTIMQKGKSLFVGVGAAHLPGTRGVIEWLRKKGYRLRPIRMADRDAVQRDQIDKIRVPVTFRDYTTPDGMIKLRVPGEMYERDDIQANTGWQYADMSNGAYYMITRVPLPGAVTGISPAELMRKTDSMLYENIPGKILKKTPIEKNGYKGLDITTKTRRGDIQRYHFYFTPFELIIIKMSGNENYTEGKEAATFFRSITLNNPQAGNQWVNFQPNIGGFSVQLPHTPYARNDYYGDWLWSAESNSGAERYLVLKRTVFNMEDLAADTLKLALMEESHIGEQKGIKTLQRVFDTSVTGSTALKALYYLPDSNYISVKYIVSGPHHFLLSAKGKNKKEIVENRMHPSFRIIPFQYATPVLYKDSLLQCTIRTPMVPVISDTLKSILHQFNGLRQYDYGNGEEVYRHFGKDYSMVFTNDTTGEVVNINYSRLGKYYSIPDSFKTKKDSLLTAIRYVEYAFNLKRLQKEYIVKEYKLSARNGMNILQVAYTDTGSTSLVRLQVMLKDDHFFTIYTVTPVSGYPGSMSDGLFNSFAPVEGLKGTPVYVSKTDSFFADYYSADTSIQKLASSAIGDIRFKESDIPRITDAMNRLQIKEKDYFERKSSWIAAIGDIPDSTAIPAIITSMQHIYEKSGDTSLFQNKVLRQLVRQRTRESYARFKDYLLQDPPVGTGDYSYDYSNDFFAYEDSLNLLKTLFPEILQLTTLEDYKKDINSLLVKLVDSGMIAPKDYESYFNMILFDARIALKKQHNQDEKKVQEELAKDDEQDNARYSGDYGSSGMVQQLLDYVTLLLPFYDKNPAVPRYFEKLWQSKDDLLRFNLMMKMIKSNRAFPDTLPAYFAGREELRGALYYYLSKLKKESLFPKKYKTTEGMARAFLYTDIPWFEDDNNDGEDRFARYNDDGESAAYSASSFQPQLQRSNMKKKMDSIELIKKEPVTWKKTKGYVYFYKYRTDKEDKWKIALSGIQPEGDSISYKNSFTNLTGVKIKEDEPLADQLSLQLKKMIYSKNKSTSKFFREKNNDYYEGLRSRFGD